MVGLGGSGAAREEVISVGGVAGDAGPLEDELAAEFLAPCDMFWPSTLVLVL